MLSYQKLPELIAQIPDPNGTAAQRIYDDHRARFEAAPGASKNHQVWPGGYVDHVTEAMNIALQLFDTLNALRPLPFTKADMLLVLFLHDLEKPFRYQYVDG